jgi:hypothetical protein
MIELYLGVIGLAVVLIGVGVWAHFRATRRVDQALRESQQVDAVKSSR